MTTTAHLRHLSTPGRQNELEPDEVYTDALALLANLADDSEEHSRLSVSQLREKFPDYRFHLISDTEAYDGSRHHDLIIRCANGPTVSLSVAPANGLPWPLRGVVRAADTDLLEVNGTRVEVAEALAGIDIIFQDRALMRTIIDGCLILQELEQDPVSLSPTELQQAADAFRRDKRLFGRDDTEAWMRDRGLNIDQFSALVTRQAELEALRCRTVGGEVDRWLAAHSDDLATVVLAWTETVAGDLAEQRRQLSANPLEAVMAAAREGRKSGVTQVIAADLLSRARPVAAFRDRTEGAMSNESARAKVAVGQTLEVELEVHAVALVLESRPVLVNEATRHLVRRRLFEAWLDERRRSARVTWFWGPSDRGSTTG